MFPFVYFYILTPFESISHPSFSIHSWPVCLTTSPWGNSQPRPRPRSPRRLKNTKRKKRRKMVKQIWCVNLVFFFCDEFAEWTVAVLLRWRHPPVVGWNCSDTNASHFLEGVNNSNKNLVALTSCYIYWFEIFLKHSSRGWSLGCKFLCPKYWIRFTSICFILKQARRGDNYSTYRHILNFHSSFYYFNFHVSSWTFTTSLTNFFSVKI